jgi:hypothetical protein
MTHKALLITYTPLSVPDKKGSGSREATAFVKNQSNRNQKHLQPGNTEVRRKKFRSRVSWR